MLLLLTSGGPPPHHPLHPKHSSHPQPWHIWTVRRTHACMHAQIPSDRWAVSGVWVSLQYETTSLGRKSTCVIFEAPSLCNLRLVRMTKTGRRVKLCVSTQANCLFDGRQKKGKRSCTRARSRPAAAAQTGLCPTAVSWCHQQGEGERQETACMFTNAHNTTNANIHTHTHTPTGHLSREQFNTGIPLEFHAAAANVRVFR